MKRSIIILLILFSGISYAQHTDPGMEAEHQAVMALVPVGSATHTAVADGNWTSAATWNTHTVPAAGARVVIPQGRTVTYNSTGTANLLWIRVDGKLQFATTQNTVLNVETIVVAPTGEYQQGTTASPIPANFTSTITFTDNGALTDPNRIARGLISHGKVRMCGAVVKPFLKTTSGLTAGAAQATLSAVPANWKVGDQVAITGMRLAGNPLSPQDELKTIAAISGSTVTFSSGLTNKRLVEFPQWGLYPYVANTTRNIRYRSANTTDHSRKGHVMFMHHPDVDIRWAGFYDLGRTRKDIELTDQDGQALPTGANPRGKYAIHFHKTGHLDANVQPAYVIGCAVVNTPGWAFVNHSSYVIFEDNVSYNAFGAHYVCEDGAERGAFRRNIAMRTGHGGRFIKTGVENHDLAHSGVGFWFQGGNTIVEDNVASGCRDGGFVWFERANGKASQPAQFTPANLLIYPEYAGGDAGLPSNDLPIMSNKNNTAYGCYHGIHLVDVEINGTGPTNSEFDNFVSLNAYGHAGFVLEYYRNFTIKNCKILRDAEVGFNEWNGLRAIEGFNLIDHRYPLQTRSADRIINLIVRNYKLAILNFGGSENDGQFEAINMAKYQVIGGAINHNCPDGDFNNKGTYLGVPLISTVASEADLLPFPTFSPAGGTYSSPRTVTISNVPGATIYYVTGPQGFQNPSVEYRLKTGSWTQYTGPVTINANSKLIAVAVRNGQYSRARREMYNINSGGGGTPGTITLQAENFTTQNGGSNSTAQSGYTGTAYYDMGGNGSWAEYVFNASAAGTYNLAIRYANGGTTNRACNVITNGATAARSFGPTGSWTTWNESTATVNLNAGSNTIRIQATTADGGANMDRLVLSPVTAARLITDNLPVVFPNPASSTVRITGIQHRVNIHIFNTASGQLVKSVSTNNGIVDVSDLATGVYLIRIQERALKLIKQ